MSWVLNQLVDLVTEKTLHTMGVADVSTSIARAHAHQIADDAFLKDFAD